jgi:mRNA-degrading endonuclease RelE of RelBE toxin-antitoxin system
MYSLEIRDHVKRLFKKIKRKSPFLLEIIKKKTKEIVSDPYRFKPLKRPLQTKRRVHIGKSFVLVFSIKDKKITIEDFDHHDNVYN